MGTQLVTVSEELCKELLSSQYNESDEVRIEFRNDEKGEITEEEAIKRIRDIRDKIINTLYHMHFTLNIIEYNTYFKIKKLSYEVCNVEIDYLKQDIR